MATTKDPVCGMTVEATDSAAHEHGGQTYHFCSRGCLEKFRADPSKYLSHEIRAGSREDPLSSEEYSCPMHPEIRQNKTGDCPKCGMALEPVMPPSTGEVTEYVCPMHPQIVRSEPGACPICGMALEPRRATAQEDTTELDDMRRRFWVSVVLTAPVLISAMGAHLPGSPLERIASGSTWTWIELLLSTPVVLWCGWPFLSEPGSRCSTAAQTCSL